jgi:archaellum component FlaC
MAGVCKMKKENLSRRIIEKIVREELSNIIEGEICDKGISYVIRTDPGGEDIKRGKDKDGDGKGDLQNWSARAAQIASKYCKDPDYGKGRGKDAKDENLEEDCWDGYERVPGSKEDAPGSCRKKTNEELEDGDKEELNTITGELAKASKMHKGQSDRIKKIAKKVKVEEAEGGLKAWEKENWTHSDGTPCGSGKKDGSKSRCKPASKWKAMSKGEKAADNRKKAKGTKAGKQYVSATKKGKVTKKHTKRAEESIEEVEYNYIPAREATYDDGNPIDFILEFWDDVVVEAEYQGRKVTLNKPMQGDVKKFKVYVKDPKTKNVKKVNFGDPNMRIKKSNPKRRKAFRNRHNCKKKMKKGDKTTAGYWSCKKW